MKLLKRDKQVSQEARGDFQGMAASSAAPGQRILAIAVGILAGGILLGSVAWKYAYPVWQEQHGGAKKDAKPAAPAETGEATASPQLNVQSILGGADDNTAASAGTGQTGAGTTTAPGFDGRQYPPGMIGHNGAGNATPQDLAPGNGQNPDQDKIAAQSRKFSGDLGVLDKNQQGQQSSSNNDLSRQSTAGAPPTAANNFNVGSGVGGTGGAAGGSNNSGTVLGGLMNGTITPTANASFIPNQHLTLAEGTSISCVLDSAILTDQPGYLSCTTDYPVYSMDGKVVLMERGTVFKGEYNRGMDQGKKAIFVLWTSGRTPMGVAVPLNSPGTDALGRAGVSGEVDDKFWPRLKGALMFSLLNDGTSIVAARASGGATGGSVLVLPNTQNATQSAVGELVKQGADVRPSLYKNQGETVAITVARNIDFSSQYRLVARTSNE